MCGIAGIAVLGAGPPPAYGQIKAMCDTIRHRGPDDEGIHIKDSVGLGMRRLSIIDLSGGSQPIFNEDRSIRVVFNGEIYNFKELRSKLESSGHIFRTKTDTEVIVHAYEEYGEDFPEYLNGMFAFALHDSARRKLFLARDHMGIKPLYYSIRAGHIIWGSEIKAILATDLVECSLNMDALGEFLAWEYVPGKKTLFKEINKLEPGAMLRVDLNRSSWDISHYWDVPGIDEDFSQTPGQWEEQIDNKISECVQRQLISDVPLGAFLSGGVDSSLVVASMENAKTFSIGFDDPTYNELKWARKVASHLNTEHFDDVIRPQAGELFGKLMYFMDDPIGDFSIFPTYLVSRHARKNVTVALSGDGGDELFGGYETYIADSLAGYYGYIPECFRKKIIEPAINKLKPRPSKKGLINKAIRFAEGIREPAELSHARWRIFTGDAMRELLFTPQARSEFKGPAGSHITKLFKRAKGRQPLNKSLYVDLKSYLTDNCLVKMDRMSMAVSLEARVPLLDKELVELAFRIPDHLKTAKGKTKILLKRVACRHVPKECVYRPKEGFSIPIKHWLKKELRPMMEELLNGDHIKKDGIFQAETVNRLKKEHLSGTSNHSHILWSLMVFHDWKKRWLKR